MRNDTLEERLIRLLIEIDFESTLSTTLRVIDTHVSMQQGD